jgi:hypothetical protein
MYTDMVAVAINRNGGSQERPILGAHYRNWPRLTSHSVPDLAPPSNPLVRRDQVCGA